ncbi:TPA: DEAD/DEAH box helicase, partial [Candidatus Micrarchaeota archaeon]|nr:DEAD/DEAH box helicase [Candidatus Micrarchaeota archaeon]
MEKGAPRGREGDKEGARGEDSGGVCIKALFANLCPNCEGEIDDVRLARKLPCERCLPREVSEKDFDSLVFRVYELLTEKRNYETVHTIVWRLKDFDSFFHRLTGSHLWSAQRTWAKRLFLGRSFSIIAPTGIGKTVFGVSMALYLAKEGERIYFVLPTTTLLKQVAERMRAFAERAVLDVNIVAVRGRMGRKAKE